MRKLAPLLLFLSLSGCSAVSPGEQSYRSVGWVRELPASISHTRSDPGYLELRLSSDTQLTGDDFNALYAHASLCPFSEARHLAAFGPLSDEARPQALPRAQLDPIAEGNSFDYLVYLPFISEVWDRSNNNARTAESVDLLRTNEDICVRLIHTTIPRATYSNVVTIPASDVSAAIRAQ